MQCPDILGSVLPRWHVLSIQVLLSKYIYIDVWLLDSIWETKLHYHNSKNNSYYYYLLILS